jgi:predicted  nucleic acid-binding Zn-ribbon protein
MAYIFDSLGYAKRLRDGGVPQAQAEAHAEAARDFIMTELATKTDLLATKQELQTDLRALQTELRTRVSETEFRSAISDLQTEFRSATSELQTEFRRDITELRETTGELRNNITELRSALETQNLRLTVRLGVMLVVAIGALATVMKLT